MNTFAKPNQKGFFTGQNASQQTGFGANNNNRGGFFNNGNQGTNFMGQNTGGIGNPLLKNNQASGRTQWGNNQLGMGFQNPMSGGNNNMGFRGQGMGMSGGFYNNGMGNQSDKELQQVLINYNSLMNSQDPRNIFRWPVFNPKHSNLAPIDFANGAHNSNPNFQYPEALIDMWRKAEHALNPDPNNLRTTILLGLETIKRRVAIQKEVTANTLKQLENPIGQVSQELGDRIEKEMAAKVRAVKRANGEILGKVIAMERKLYLIAKRLKSVSLNLEAKMKIVEIFKELGRQTVILDERINDLKLMIDGNTSLFIIILYHNNNILLKANTNFRII